MGGGDGNQKLKTKMQNAEGMQPLLASAADSKPGHFSARIVVAGELQPSRGLKTRGANGSLHISDEKGAVEIRRC